MLVNAIAHASSGDEGGDVAYADAHAVGYYVEALADGGNATVDFDNTGDITVSASAFATGGTAWVGAVSKTGGFFNEGSPLLAHLGYFHAESDEGGDVLVDFANTGSVSVSVNGEATATAEGGEALAEAYAARFGAFIADANNGGSATVNVVNDDTVDLSTYLSASALNGEGGEAIALLHDSPWLYAWATGDNTPDDSGVSADVAVTNNSDFNVTQNVFATAEDDALARISQKSGTENDGNIDLQAFAVGDADANATLTNTSSFDIDIDVTAVGGEDAAAHYAAKSDDFFNEGLPCQQRRHRQHRGRGRDRHYRAPGRCDRRVRQQRRWRVQPGDQCPCGVGWRSRGGHSLR